MPRISSILKYAVLNRLIPDNPAQLVKVEFKKGERKITRRPFTPGDLTKICQKLKATNVGTFTVPPLQGEGMYARTIIARSTGSKLTVTK
mgnify:CR=1 FL=1